MKLIKVKYKQKVMYEHIVMYPFLYAECQKTNATKRQKDEREIISGSISFIIDIFIFE
jgi:hypothetical protein